MKNKPSRILNWHKHDVVWRSEPLPPSFASNYRKMFLAAMAYNGLGMVSATIQVLTLN